LELSAGHSISRPAGWLNATYTFILDNKNLFMKQKVLCVLAICLPFFAFCQHEKLNNGIKWIKVLSWKEVQKKAKKENKYIFVDCYATWCKPCKQMDKEVYSVDSVANYLNAGFLSVKIQMDVTANDNVETRKWHKTAKNFGSQYRISAYPSYIFFSPNGDAVYKETGYRDAGAFIQMTRNATDPSKQYFLLLRNYKKGKLDDPATRSLINLAKEIGDTADYRQLVTSYHARLRNLPKEELYTKENIEFVASTLDRSNMELFGMFYPDGTEVNKVMQSDWYSQRVVDNIIFKEKVNAFLSAEEGKPEPDWNILFNTITKNYKSEYADRIVMDAKIRWYQFYGDLMKYTMTLNDKMEKYGSDTTSRGEDFRLNNQAFIIWENLGATAMPSKEVISELSRVTAWMEGVVRRGATAAGERLTQWPLYIDTYATLLHKIGRTSEAIKWEEFAILKCKETGDYGNYIEDYKDRLNKMKKGEPTWPIKSK
jgi:thioredoxin-related protein